MNVSLFAKSQISDFKFSLCLETVSIEYIRKNRVLAISVVAALRESEVDGINEYLLYYLRVGLAGGRDCVWFGLIEIILLSAIPVLFSQYF